MPQGASITINALHGISDSLDATGASSSTGIGYDSGNCGNITINNGTVNATGVGYGAGIGGAYSDGSSVKIVINGGTVTATGNLRSAGIGGRAGCPSGIIQINNINNTKVYAYGGPGGPESAVEALAGPMSAGISL